MRTIRIATRKSPLAMWQAEFAARQIRALHPQQPIEILGMVTQGDRILETPLAEIGGKGLFVKELEQAMYEGRADLAVHSMKDVPMELPPGMAMSVIFPREDPLDAFVSTAYASLDKLPAGARLGTSSLRRRSQLLAARPDLEVLDLRGNVNTRLAKLDDGEFDAIILAKAGLIRLGMEERISAAIPPDICLPAVGQGAVGVEIRDGDRELADLLAPLNDAETAACVEAERAMSRDLQGNCQVPLAGYAHWLGDELELTGVVADVQGARVLRVTRRASPDQAGSLGKAVATQLRKEGAAELLAEIMGG